MRAAVVSDQTHLVLNMIIANAAVDPAPEGSFLVGVNDNSPIGMGWRYADGNFIDPADNSIWTPSQEPSPDSDPSA